MIVGIESMGMGAVLMADTGLQSCIDNTTVHWFKLTDEFGHEFPLIPHYYCSLPIK